MNKMNKKEAFAFFGIKQTNERWSWAGIRDDKSLVALTIWNDQKDYESGGKWETSVFGMNNPIWKDSKGNKERIKIIKYCIENLDGKFRVIWMEPKERGVMDETREYLWANPEKKSWFKIRDFDEETGEFSSDNFDDLLSLANE